MGPLAIRCPNTATNLMYKQKGTGTGGKSSTSYIFTEILTERAELGCLSASPNKLFNQLQDEAALLWMAVLLHG